MICIMIFMVIQLETRKQWTCPCILGQNERIGADKIKRIKTDFSITFGELLK